MTRFHMYTHDYIKCMYNADNQNHARMTNEYKFSKSTVSTALSGEAY